MVELLIVGMLMLTDNGTKGDACVVIGGRYALCDPCTRIDTANNTVVHRGIVYRYNDMGEYLQWETPNGKPPSRAMHALRSHVRDSRLAMHDGPTPKPILYSRRCVA